MRNAKLGNHLKLITKLVIPFKMKVSFERLSRLAYNRSAVFQNLLLLNPSQDPSKTKLMVQYNNFYFNTVVIKVLAVMGSCKHLN